MAKTFKEELLETGKVEKVEFVGGGITRITLKPTYGNPNFEGYHSEQQSICAPFDRTAWDFVNGAEGSNYGNYPGGGAGRVKAGTPRSCNPQSELYWCM